MSKASQVRSHVHCGKVVADKSALKWFPAGSSDPVDYQGGRDLDSLAKLSVILNLAGEELIEVLLRNLVRNPRSSPLLLLLLSRLPQVTLTMSF